MSSERDERGSVVAGERGVAIGGNAEHNVIITGDNAQVHQDTTLKDFLALLDKLRTQVRTSELDADTQENIAAQVDLVDRQAKHKTPKPSIILNNLRAVVDILKESREAGVALIPMARQLGEMASFLF